MSKPAKVGEMVTFEWEGQQMQGTVDHIVRAYDGSIVHLMSVNGREGFFPVKQETTTAAKEAELIRRKARAFDWLCERGGTFQFTEEDDPLFLYKEISPLETVEKEMQEYEKMIRASNERERIE